MAKQTVPGTKGFQYDFGNYSTDDNPFSLLRNSSDAGKFNATERLNQRARIFIAGYDVTQDVESFTITNNMDTGMTATMNLLNPRDRYRVTRNDLETNIYNVLEENPKRYGNKDILPTYDLEGRPFSLTSAGINGLVYKREMNNLYEKDTGGSDANINLQYKDYLFKHMLFLVKWHSGIRKQENDFIFDYKEPVIIFLQGRFSTFWYFGFTGGIISYNSTFSYGGENAISLTLGSRRHFLGIKSRVLTPAIAQNLVETRNVAANNASQSMRPPIKEQQSGKRIEDIIPDLFLAQTSLNESFKYPVFPVNFMKTTDRSSRAQSWLQFFKTYLIKKRESYVRQNKDTTLNALFTDAFSGLNAIYEKLLFNHSDGYKGFDFEDKTRQFNYLLNIPTRDIYNGIDKYVDPLFFKPPQDEVTDKIDSVTDRRDISDPLNKVYSAILGDNIYQVSVFSVKPYSGRNINTILEANTLRFWETDFGFGGKGKNDNCVWRVNKSAGVIGVHPAVHEDFVNSFHILPKIFDAVVNNRHTHSKVLDPGTPEKVETLKGAAFKLSDEGGVKFTASKYSFVNQSSAINTINSTKVKTDEGDLTLKEYITKYRNRIDEISIVGHASFNPTDGYRTKRNTPESFLTKKIEARLTGLYRATVVAEYIISEDYTRVINNFVTPDVRDKYNVDLNLDLGKALRGVTPFLDPSFKELRDKIKVYSFGYSIPANQSEETANNILGTEDSNWGSPEFTSLLSGLIQKAVPAVALTSNPQEKTAYIDSILEGSAFETDFNEVANEEPNIVNIVEQNAKDDAISRMKISSSEGNQVVFDFTKHSPAESKHRKNRRVEIFIKVKDEIVVTPAVNPTEVVEGICIELADRTPYDKLKEQVYGVPTETSKIVTGLNFHRPRFIVLIPPLFMSNASPLSLGFRNFVLDQQDYGSMKDVLDSICKTTQYVYSETPMGDVIMEPMNYDLAPWDMSSAYFGKEKFAAYSSNPDHVLEDTGANEGTFMQQNKDIKHVNIYPTYISTFRKGQMVGVPDANGKNEQRNIPDNINLPVVKPVNVRHPYNIDKINDLNLVYSFKGDTVYTAILVMGSNNTGNVQSNALLQGVLEKDSGTQVILSKLSSQLRVVNRNIYKSDAIVAGQYVADGFELEQDKLEIEKLAAKVSLKLRSAANSLADAILRGNKPFFDELLFGKDGTGGWFGGTLVKGKPITPNSDYGTTFRTLLNNVLLPYIKEDVKVYNDSVTKKASSAKDTKDSKAPTTIPLKGKIDAPEILDRIHSEVSIVSPGAIGEQKIFSEIGGNFPRGKVSGLGDNVLLLDYPILTETVSASARASLVEKFIPKDSAPEIDRSLSDEDKRVRAKEIFESRKSSKVDKIDSLEERCRTTIQLYMLYLLSKSPKGKADLQALEKLLNKYESPSTPGTEASKTVSASRESAAGSVGAAAAKKNSGENKPVNAKQKVIKSFKPVPFTYSDLAALRIKGAYNPQADFVNLYGYVVYNPITIPWLQTPVDCQVYAMAFFNQFYNNTFSYTANDLPMTPELLVNRPAYMSYLNSIGLIRSITTSYTANTSASMSLGISYIRRNIIEKSSGGYWEYPDDTGATQSTMYKYGNSYSISDITLDQQVEIDKTLSKDPAGGYSAFRKLGMLHESLAVSAESKVYQSQKDNSAGSRLQALLEKQEYFQSLYYTTLAEIDAYLFEFSANKRLYLEERVNYRKLEAAYQKAGGDISALTKENERLNQLLKTTRSNLVLQNNALTKNQAQKTKLSVRKYDLERQLDAGTVGPPPVPNYPLTEEGKPILAELIIVTDDLEKVNIAIAANTSAINALTSQETTIVNEIAANNAIIEDKKVGVNITPAEQKKSLEGLKRYITVSDNNLSTYVDAMNENYEYAMGRFACLYGVMFNYKVTPAKNTALTEFTGYLSADKEYSEIFKIINVYSDDKNILDNHASRWSDLSKTGQYITQIGLNTVTDILSFLGMPDWYPADDFFEYDNILPVTIALHQINSEIEKIYDGDPVTDAQINAVLAESVDVSAKTGASVRLIKQGEIRDIAGGIDSRDNFACNFSCVYMVFELYTRKKGGTFMTPEKYKVECVNKGAMRDDFFITDYDKMAAAAGFNGLKRKESSDVSIIPSLIDKGIPVIIYIDQPHFEVIDGYTKTGKTYKFSVKDPGKQLKPLGDTSTDSTTKILVGDGGVQSSNKKTGKKPRKWSTFYYYPV